MDDEKLLVPVRQDIDRAEWFGPLLGATAQNRIHDRPGWEWAMLLRAIKSARERYTTALGTDLGIVARIAVGEALWWISAADEFLRVRVSVGLNSKAYYEVLTSTMAGRRIAGLVYLRHSAGHRFAQALTTGHESTSKTVEITVRGRKEPAILTFAATMSHGLKAFETAPAAGYLFEELSFLPAPDPGHPERFGRDEHYKLAVGGRNVLDVLLAAELSLRPILQFDDDGRTVRVQVHEMPPAWPRKGSA